MIRKRKPSAYRYRRGTATTYVTFNFVEACVDNPHNAYLAAVRAGIVVENIIATERDDLVAAATRNGHFYIATSVGASDEALQLWAHDQDAVEAYRIEPLQPGQGPAPRPARGRR